MSWRSGSRACRPRPLCSSRSLVRPWCWARSWTRDDPPTDSSFALSRDGRRFARRLNDQQVEVREVPGDRPPVFVTPREDVWIHFASLGRSCLLVREFDLGGPQAPAFDVSDPMGPRTTRGGSPKPRPDLPGARRSRRGIEEPAAAAERLFITIASGSSRLWSIAELRILIDQYNHLAVLGTGRRADRHVLRVGERIRRLDAGRDASGFEPADRAPSRRPGPPSGWPRCCGRPNGEEGEPMTVQVAFAAPQRRHHRAGGRPVHPHARCVRAAGRLHATGPRPVGPGPRRCRWLPAQARRGRWPSRSRRDPPPRAGPGLLPARRRRSSSRPSWTMRRPAWCATGDWSSCRAAASSGSIAAPRWISVSS